MRIVFCGTGWLNVVQFIAARLAPGDTIRVRDPARPVSAEISDAEVLLPSNCPIGAEALAGARDLVLIQQPAAGYDAIDLEAARSRGIPVCNVPGGNAVSVGEAVLLVLLSLARRLPLARRAFEEAKIGAPLGIQLAGRKLGLVGEGRTGGQVRKVAEGIGMEVRSVRSKSSRDDLLALLGWADFVSLHLPLSPATRGAIGPAEMAAMKPGAYLVNFARGPVIDRAALESALDSGHLGGVGLDCFWKEPWDPTDPLYARPNVVTLPHIGGTTEEAFATVADTVAENIRRFRAGEPLLHRIA